jgi:uncharacterized cofD-like protein
MKKKYQKIVELGGGKAAACLVGHKAEYLKEDPSDHTEITVIQHPWDDGGHTGQIVDEYGMLGPGDYRKSILAFAKPWLPRHVYQALIRRTWHPEQVRPSKRTMLTDEPPLGNLIMLSGMLDYVDVDLGKGLLQGIDVFSYLCRLQKRFKVMPVSLDPATLVADLADGTSIVGQSQITKHFDYDKKRILSVKLVPPNGMRHPQLYDEARKAIMEADKIVITPGSPWTSIWPNTLPDGFRDAMSETKAKIIMVVNLVTEKSEAARWNSSDFIEKLFGAVGRSFDTIICNDWETSLAHWKSRISREEKSLAELLRKYEQQEFFPVLITKPPPSQFSKTGYLKRADTIITDHFAHWDGKSLSHNKLTARTILDL